MDGADALLKKAVALHEAGKFGEAASLYRDILMADPENVTAIHLMALVAMQFDNAAMVLALSEQGLRIQPRLAVLHQDRATALRRMGHKQEALKAIETAIELESGLADLYDTLSAVQRDLRLYDRAIESLKKASRMEPDNPKYYNNLAICLGRIGANEEALACMNRYIEMKPGAAEGYNNKANILKSLRRYQEAIAHYDKALAIDPAIFMGRANKGIAHLILGDYTNGWPLFEDRKPGNKPPENDRFDPKKRWQGQKDPNATLVLYHEQGLGDTVQFCRYLPLIRAQVKTVLMQVQPPLKRFLQTNWPDIHLFTADDPLPDHDFQCPLMSLPTLFHTTTATIPFAAGYLHADKARITAWQGRLPRDGKKKIGLVWAGNPDHMNDHIRSIAFPLLAPLWQAQNVHFISLQKGKDSSAQIASLPPDISFTHLGDALDDFSDTAALLKTLDLLLTVDTSVLHVAGALGVPAWLMLQYDPDWRWMTERSDTPWYKSVRLFRQKNYADWMGVIEEVRAALCTQKI